MRYIVEFDDGERFEIELDPGRQDLVVVDGRSRELQVERTEGGAEVTTEDGKRARLKLDYEDGHLVLRTPDGRRRRVRVELAEAEAWRRAVSSEPPPRAAAVPDALHAPIAGNVLALLVDSGAVVRAGDALLVIEAMKMQNSIAAPKTGCVTFSVAVGQTVRAGDLLATITETEVSE